MVVPNTETQQTWQRTTVVFLESPACLKTMQKITLCLDVKTESGSRCWASRCTNVQWDLRTLNEMFCGIVLHIQVHLRALQPLGQLNTRPDSVKSTPRGGSF